MNDADKKQGLPVVLFARGRETIVYLASAIEYDTGKLGKITVPQGFESDGCSIPRILWRVVGHPFDMKYLKEAILHDYLYATQPCTRKEADKTFRDELKKNNKLGAVKRFLIYQGVRTGGWVAWNNHKKTKGIRMKTLTMTMLLLAILASGCKNTSLAWRGVNIVYYQTAENEGKITNKPENGDASVAAEKTTDLKADIPITK